MLTSSFSPFLSKHLVESEYNNDDPLALRRKQEHEMFEMNYISRMNNKGDAGELQKETSWDLLLGSHSSIELRSRGFLNLVHDWLLLKASEVIGIIIFKGIHW